MIALCSAVVFIFLKVGLESAFMRTDITLHFIRKKKWLASFYVLVVVNESGALPELSVSFYTLSISNTTVD